MPEPSWVLRLRRYLDFAEAEARSVLGSSLPRSRYDQERYAGAQVILDRIPALREMLDFDLDGAELAGRILDLAIRQMTPEVKMVMVHQSWAEKGAARQKAKHLRPSPRDAKIRALAAKLKSSLNTTAKAVIIQERLAPKRRRGGPLSVRQIRRIISSQK